ncbi:MAG: hypothetical protein CVV64_13470 [Candidatus Wallbacteria bacterium HGW-Wallbacteria-1]|jgi:hypothetical protein|uniref:Glycosyltransferase RgtA/B/C/D-like domain-containing protein n=1 Tax=Candidatus Wallbacteria bacterium HGW-Wallbacteria-1 TaxID=2013854 RepID=A0A2N1PMJ8_9BACT|nr:MAG: hypothetical protein CVV64_13470 [Candidatus Wallbacteria bacterium HGW-Wallbacteria-1]
MRIRPHALAIPLLWLLLFLPDLLLPAKAAAIGLKALIAASLTLTALLAFWLEAPMIASLAALFARVIPAIFLATRNVLPEIYVLDENSYRAMAQAMELDPSLLWDRSVPFFPKISWIINSLFSHPLYGEKVITALAGTLAVILAWAFLKKLVPTLPQWGIWLIALNPSLIFWSSMHLKDTFLTTLAALSLLILSSSHSRKARWQGLAITVISLAAAMAMFPIRNYWCLALAGAICAGALAWALEERPCDEEARGSGWKIINLTVPAILVIALVAGLFLMTRFLRPAQFENVHNNMCHYSQSPINPDITFATWKNFFLYLPRGGAAFLFSPYPWETPRTGFHLLSQIESGIYIILLPLGFMTMLRRGFRNWDPGTTALITFIGIILFMHSFMEGNVGTSVRHRIIILIFLLPLAAEPIKRLLNSSAEQQDSGEQHNSGKQ